MDTNALVTGGVGGIVATIVKYVIDRSSEAHKAALGVAAKRREKFNSSPSVGLRHGLWLERCARETRARTVVVP